MIYLYIFLGGGLGSIARFGTSRLTERLVSTSFPLGTLIANLLACALLAIFVILANKSDADWMKPLLLVGFCGGFSTFSTFGNETFMLLDSGNTLYAVLNILISVVVGVGLIYLIKATS